MKIKIYEIGKGSCRDEEVLIRIGGIYGVRLIRIYYIYM